MQTKHKISEPVEAYLLGTMDEAEAVKLEMKYFTDRSVLQRVQAVESTLIEDYFENRLSSKDKRLFEDRYLEVPALKRRVEEVRIQHQLTTSRVKRTNLLVLSWVAAAIVLCLFGVGTRRYWLAGKVQPALVASAPRPAPIAVLNLRLSPGVTKSGTQKAARFAVPLKGPVDLSLELPGRKAGDSYVVRILTIDANGHFILVWTSRAVRSESRDGGSVITVEPDSAIFHPADYLVQVTAMTGAILETYQFQVSANIH